MKGLMRAGFRSAVALVVLSDPQRAAASWDPITYLRHSSATEVGVIAAVAMIVVLALAAIVRDFRRPRQGGDPYRPMD